VRFLLERQRADGTWSEKEWTGTGFPQVFYMKYHLYSHYWPLMALVQYRDARRSSTRRQEARTAAKVVTTAAP
jgi:squalene-hopene/tetraprenyl-beta-curcumene cyclase